MARAAFDAPQDGGDRNQEKGSSSDDEPDELREAPSLSVDEDLSTLRMQSQAKVQIYFRNNPYYQDLIPKLREHLEERFGHSVEIKSFERGTDPEEIRESILQDRQNLNDSLLLFDVTCRRSFPESQLNLDEIDSRFMPLPLGSYIDRILLNQVAGELEQVTINGRATLSEASPKMREACTKLESSHRAVVHLLKLINEGERDFDEVLLTARHLNDHLPFLDFYYSTLLEYMQNASRQLAGLSATNGTSEEHARITAERGRVKEFFEAYSAFPLGELYFSATLPDDVHEILQREVGDRIGIQIPQPTNLLKSWIEESGIADGNIRVLPNKALDEFGPGELAVGPKTLLITDRHFCNRDELEQKGISVQGAVALFPMTDFYDSLRDQQLVTRRDLLDGEDILDQLVEDLSDAIRRAELNRAG